MEFLDIRDKNGNPTGEVKERSLVHAMEIFMELLMYGLCGKMKKAVMICCYRNVVKIKMHFQDAMIFLLQDIYSRSGLPFFCIKGTGRRLGIKAKPEQLHFMGLHEGCCEETFYGKPFKNHEISHVYCVSGTC